MSYIEVPFDDIKGIIDQSVLIITATNIETEILHKFIEPINDDGNIYKVHHEDKTFYVGQFGAYACIHVQCGTMGSVGPSSSLKTVLDSIRIFNSKITIMIGIAFGVDPDNQNIGDVLVADVIVPYDNKKIVGGKSIVRATPVNTSAFLLDRFRNARDWEFQLETGRAQKIIAPIFSGEELINDIDRRVELQKINPLAKGGEMEGAGLHSGANGKTEWILVKGICDFADGNKDHNKDENQRIAMRSAVSLCQEVFSSLHSFESLHLYPLIKTEISSRHAEIEPSVVNKVLFDFYSPDLEPFYFEREKDLELNKIMNYYSFWISGKSGRGKSISIHRNLIKSEYEFVQVNLANCIGLEIDDFFYEIYVELLSKVDPHKIVESKREYQDSIRKINVLIGEHFKGKTIFILIDEIPLGNDGKFADFVQKICSLFITSSPQSDGTIVRYALSSIHSPVNHIPDFQEKILSNLKFVKFDDWNEEECMGLIQLIEQALPLNLTHSNKKRIIEKSNGSPRWIKNVLKNLLMLGDISEQNLEMAITQTQNIL